jgi:hypothetical protein
VVVVVVSFAESDECGDDVVSWRVSVIEGLVAEVMGKGVDAECGMVDKDESADTGVKESPSPVTPTKTSNDSGEEEAHGEDNDSVILVLHADEGIRIEIRDIGTANTFGVLFEDHPTEMSVHQAFSDRVWIFLCVGVTMMSAMVSRPPSNGAFDCAATKSSQDVFQRSRCVI